MVPPTPIRRRAEDQDELERVVPIRRSVASDLDNDITPDERARAAVDDARAANDGVHRARRRLRRHSTLLLGVRRDQRRDRKTLARIEQAGRDHAEALGDVSAAIINRELAVATTTKDSARLEGAKAAAPVGALGLVALLILEILKLLNG